MSGDQSYQEKWGLRGKEVVDSSSEESESNSLDNEILKKHRLIPSSEMPETEENSISQDKEVVDPHKASSSKLVKSGKKCKEILSPKNQIRKPAKPAEKRKIKRNRNKRVEIKPDPYDGLKVFSKSLFDELKVAREDMFARANEELGIIAPEKSVPRPKKKKPENLIEKEKLLQEQVKLGKRPIEVNSASSKKPPKSRKGKGVVIEDGVVNDKNTGPVSLNEKTKTSESNLPPKEATYSLAQNLTGPGNQSGISLPQNNEMPPQGFFTSTQRNSEIPLQGFITGTQRNNEIPLPAFITGTQRNNDIPLQGFITGTQRNNEVSPQGFFTLNQRPEQFQNLSQMGMYNMDYFNQMMNRSSSLGFPLHQGMGNDFGFLNQDAQNLARGTYPNQAMENLTRGTYPNPAMTYPNQAMESLSRGNDILGPRVDGGAMRFSGGNTFGNFAGNNSSGKSD